MCENDRREALSEASEQGMELRRYEFAIKGSITGRRIDSYLANRFPDYSRTFIRKLIDEKAITVNGRPVKASYSPRKGDRVVCCVPVIKAESVAPEDIPLSIIYEDDWLLVVNKPPDIVVHPAPGHTGGTLVNALVHHCQRLAGGPCGEGGFAQVRPGIVHRLDRDTSGVILVVKDESIHQEIARQFRDREVTKEYLAVCEGTIELDGDVIDAPLGPHRRDRERVAVREDIGKEARTAYEVVERMAGFTVVRCFPHTGRTHQIRVHMQYIGHPIVADSLYGVREAVYLCELVGPARAGPAAGPGEAEPLLARQALHARRLTAYHPVLRKQMCFEAEVPQDMRGFIEALREHGE